MKPVLDKIELGQMEEWNFTASDGTEIKGMICLPPSFDPNKKYPPYRVLLWRNDSYDSRYNFPVLCTVVCVT